MFHIKNKSYYYGNTSGIDAGFRYDPRLILDRVDLTSLHFKRFVLKGGRDSFVVQKNNIINLDILVHPSSGAKLLGRRLRGYR